jgi:hypothetical protein
VLFTVDGRGTVIAARRGDSVGGHWSTDPLLIAAADILFASLRGVAR